MEACGAANKCRPAVADVQATQIGPVSNSSVCTTAFEASTSACWSFNWIVVPAAAFHSHCDTSGLSSSLLDFMEQVAVSVQGCNVPAGDALVADVDTLVSRDSMVVLVDENVFCSPCEFSDGLDLPPMLDVSQSVALCNDQIFPNIGEAEDCVLGNAKAEDAAGGCRPIVLNVDTINVNGLCEHKVMARANEGRLA
mgnify:CR=1 FL=1